MKTEWIWVQMKKESGYHAYRLVAAIIQQVRTEVLVLGQYCPCPSSRGPRANRLHRLLKQWRTLYIVFSGVGGSVNNASLILLSHLGDEGTLFST